MERVTLKALIIDDEPLAHKVILNFANDIPFLEIVGQSYLAIDALEFLKNQQVDLIFLDMQMPKLKGLDFLRILPQKPLVIVTSAHQEFALESFELDVCDYLLKPFRFDRFLKAVNKAAELQKLKAAPSETSTTTEEPENDQIFIKSDKRHIQLRYADIYYLESHGNYVKVWLENQFHLTPKTLTSFEEALPGDIFLRIHKSFIVNLRHVHYLEGNQLVMRNGTALLIGRSHRKAVKGMIGGEV